MSQIHSSFIISSSLVKFQDSLLSQCNSISNLQGEDILPQCSSLPLHGRFQNSILRRATYTQLCILMYHLEDNLSSSGQLKISRYVLQHQWMMVYITTQEQENSQIQIYFTQSQISEKSLTTAKIEFSTFQQISFKKNLDFSLFDSMKTIHKNSSLS